MPGIIVRKLAGNLSACFAQSSFFVNKKVLHVYIKVWIFCLIYGDLDFLQTTIQGSFAPQLPAMNMFTLPIDLGDSRLIKYQVWKNPAFWNDMLLYAYLCVYINIYIYTRQVKLKVNFLHHPSCLLHFEQQPHYSPVSRDCFPHKNQEKLQHSDLLLKGTVWTSQPPNFGLDSFQGC